MKYSILILSISLAALFLVSCNSSETREKQPDYMLKERLGADITSVDTSNEEEKPDPTITPDIDDENTSQMKEETDYWSFLSVFKGITSDAETPALANLGTNMKQDTDYSYVVCSDPISDAIYYINYGDDYYIYELKGDKSTLLVEKMASNLQIWEDNLYFLGYKDDNAQIYSDYDTGKCIYKFNLKTKELELLRETTAFKLFISSEGIFYGSKELLEGHDYEVYGGKQLEFGNSTPKNINRLLFAVYKDYYLVNKPDKVLLKNKNSDKEETTVIPFDALSSKVSINNNMLYYKQGLKLFSLNLDNGKGNIYDIAEFNDIIGKFDPGEKERSVELIKKQYDKYKDGMIIHDYTVFKDEIYVACGSMCKIDKNGRILLINSENHDYSIIKLNTSGDRLFAVCTKKGGFEFVELIITEDGLTYKDIGD